MLKTIMERRAALKAKLEALHAAAVDENGESRSMTDDENTEFDATAAEIRKLDERINELQEAEKRENLAAAHRVELGLVPTGDGVHNEPNPIYRKGDNSTSFFRDLASSQLNQSIRIGGGNEYLHPNEARGRLVAAQENRAGDMTSGAGAGGEFAPPLWLIQDFIALARAGRVTADLFQQNPLPGGISSISLPKVSSGATEGVQATQNSALSDTAMTTTSVSTGITTVGGKQIISMQLLQQSGIPFDKVILQDLAKAYAIQVDTQGLYGTNANGQVLGLVGVSANTAFTTATAAPSSVTNANSLYYAVSKAAAAVWTAIYEDPDAVVMHPKRWAWIVGSVDTAGRPLVVPNGPSFNALGTTGTQVAQGLAGYFGSYPVYLDPNISLTANSTSGTTAQDEIYVLKRDQVWLYESAVQSEAFTATYADNASVLFRVMGYMGLIANRYTGAVGSIRGTGMLLPT